MKRARQAERERGGGGLGSEVGSETYGNEIHRRSTLS